MYTSITPAFRAAAEIEQITADTISFVEARLKNLYELAADPEVLEVFGKNAVTALTAYSAFLQALTVVKPNHNAPSFDLTVFQPQPDGSVLFVAPEPELASEPIIDSQPI
jgi:hypothetical protein